MAMQNWWRPGYQPRSRLFQNPPYMMYAWTLLGTGGVRFATPSDWHGKATGVFAIMTGSYFYLSKALHEDMANVGGGYVAKIEPPERRLHACSRFLRGTGVSMIFLGGMLCWTEGYARKTQSAGPGA
eukprot:TRINITY_DN43790_c0_g1_i1.p2 TRINITY_DN43790_c0_g1~~TRINITY_DN43790_c0_g1_i1.p2  ORF type:complete len:127 (-),score=12.61 TRINITY_DN43790_c0_g1_i1:271-651(-)